MNDDNRYQFDQTCRVKAVTLAQKLGIECRLNINFLPNAVYEPASCIQTTIKAADEVGFPVENIVFEFLESEEIKDREHLKRIVTDYQARGMNTAIDDFGAGYAGLGLLAEYQPDFLKLDMLLVRDVDTDEKKHIILKGMIEVAYALNIRIIAEGVETRGEMQTLKDLGVELIQGYYFAKPGFECLPNIQNL
ncbi:EAL domain-containing protein [Bermanella marisrubri]|uniref:EAL domain-containing protein n=1 Tax=Bermanella marisrubri TaxID=207949 RepID=UPI000A035909|nr:EAL domain-containing protein [Bermanella marisrubri]